MIWIVLIDLLPATVRLSIGCFSSSFTSVNPSAFDKSRFFIAVPVSSLSSTSERFLTSPVKIISVAFENFSVISSVGILFISSAFVSTGAEGTFPPSPELELTIIEISFEAVPALLVAFIVIL